MNSRPSATIVVLNGTNIRTIPNRPFFYVPGPPPLVQLPDEIFRSAEKKEYPRTEFQECDCQVSNTGDLKGKTAPSRIAVSSGKEY
jgi:hypothetical protein